MERRRSRLLKSPTERLRIRKCVLLQLLAVALNCSSLGRATPWKGAFAFWRKGFVFGKHDCLGLLHFTRNGVVAEVLWLRPHAHRAARPRLGGGAIPGRRRLSPSLHRPEGYVLETGVSLAERVRRAPPLVTAACAGRWQLVDGHRRAVCGRGLSQSGSGPGEPKDVGKKGESRASWTSKSLSSRRRVLSWSPD